MAQQNNILKEDEKILWKRVENVKLDLSLYPLLVLLPFNLLIYWGTVSTGMTFFSKFLIQTILFIVVLSVMIIGNILIINIVIGSNRRILQILEVSSKEELKKDYKIVQAITNQRVILKDVRHIDAIRRYDKKRPISKVDFNKDYW